MASLVKTIKALGHTRPARSFILKVSNADLANKWLGDKAELTWRKRGGEDTPRLRIKTEKGIRVAEEGDTVVKFGRGADSTYLVIKAYS